MLIFVGLTLLFPLSALYVLLCLLSFQMAQNAILTWPNSKVNEIYSTA